MTTLIQRTLEDLKVAMRNKDELRKGVLTLLRAALLNEEKKTKRTLDEAGEVEITKREINQSKGLIVEAQKANRTDIIEKENQKIAVLEEYLPTMLTEDEIVAYLKSQGVEKGANIGKTMGILMKEHKSNVDGTFAREVITKHFA